MFDGIDIDWEWPGSDGNTGNVIRPQDKQNFTLLMAEFRRQLDAYGASVGRHYSLSAFLPADPAKIAAGFEVPQVFSSLDWATVQGYDFHGAWETVKQKGLGGVMVWELDGDDGTLTTAVDTGLR